MQTTSEAPPDRVVSAPRLTEPDLVPSSVWFGPFVSERLERDFMAFLGTHNGVAVLTWPRDREHAEHLACAGVPRLLLVLPTTAPPRDAPLQAWLPSDASHSEIHECLLTLSRAAAWQRSAAGPPTLDDDGRLHVGEAFVALPVAARGLAGVLVDSFEVPVTCSILRAAANDTSMTALRCLLRHVDERANTLGLEIVPAPGDAYLLRRCPLHAASTTSSSHPRPILTMVPSCSSRPAASSPPARTLGRHRTLPMHFRSGLLAPDLP